jgi:hypothetical protein
MESRVSRKGLFRSHTEDSHNVYRKKFADFLSEEFNPNLAFSLDCYTDEKISSFIAHIGEQNDHKVSQSFFNFIWKAFIL